MNKKILGYYRILWKRSLRILPEFFLTLCITGGILLLAGIVMSGSTGETKILPKASVAIVIEDNSAASSIAANIVENMESVKLITDFVYVSAEQADAGLQSGKYQAAVYVSKDIYNDIDSGKNTPIPVKISESSGLSSQLFQDLMNIGISLLQTGEATVYAIYDLSGEYLLTGSSNIIMTRIAQQFLTLALQRNQVWISTVVSPFGNIDMLSFYIVTAFLIIAVVLCGISFSSLYRHDLNLLERNLVRYRVGAVHRTLARLLSITGILWILNILLCGLTARISGYTSFDLLTIPLLLPLAFSEAALIHLIHIVTRRIGGSFAALIVGLLIFAVGGGIFPSAYLPSFARTISEFLPVHTWQNYLYHVIQVKGSAELIWEVLLFGLIFLLLGMAGDICYEKDNS